MRCFLIVFFVFSCINAAEISLTPEEKRFIRDNETIVLGIDETLKPFVLTQPEGEVTGFEAQVLKRVNEITGANFVLKPCEIGKLRDQAAEGRIHGLASHTPPNQQQSPFILTQSYLQMQKLVLAASDNAYTMQDRSSLKGKTVAVYRHNLLDKKLAAQLENAAIKEFDTLKDTISSVVTQETDVMFSNGSVFHITNEMGLPSLTPVYRFDTLASHHYALNKAFSPAASILDKALQVMDKEELLALKNRWFSKSLSSSLAKQHRRLVLNFEEKEDLIGRDAIKMCRENIQNPAYEKYLGVNSELIEEVERLLLKNFEPVKTEDMAQSFSYLNQDRCDVVSTVQTARLDNDDVLFSKPYLEIPIVLATQSDRSSIVDINYLKDFKVAVVKHRGIVSNVLSGYENLKVYETKSLSEAFAMVTSKKADAVVGALGVLSEYIKLHSYDFKINGTFNEKLYLAFAVSKDDAIMRGTLNKTIDNISKSKKDEIMNRWFGVRYEKGIDYTVVWLVAAPLAVALLFYIVRIYDLKRINKGLQGVIKKELETSRKKDNLIFQQNKLAATGELITTIAHQWKQPLSELGMSQNLLMTKIENNNVSHSQLMQELYEQQRIVSFMSKTINTFKNFLDFQGIIGEKEQ